MTQRGGAGSAGNVIGAGRLLTAACVLLMAVTAAGCSGGTDGGTDKDPEPAGRTAGQICAATLDPAAAAALEEISGTDRFSELAGADEAGEPNAFDLERAVAHFDGPAAERSTCAIYKAGDTSGHPLVEIGFEPSGTFPKRGAIKKADLEDYTFYPVGTYASTRAEGSAALFFSCAAPGAKSGAAYVHASLFSTTGQFAKDSTSKERMTILTSVSRHLAAGLGCAEQARLPSRLPPASR